MGRRPDGATARDVIVAVRLTPAGAAALDDARGEVSRSRYLREALAAKIHADRRTP